MDTTNDEGVTRHRGRPYWRTFFVSVGLTGMVFGGGLVATAGNASAAPTMTTVSVNVNASAPGGIDNPSITSNVPDNYYDLDVKSSTGEVQWYVTLSGGVPDSNGFTEIMHTGSITCGQDVGYQLLLVQTEGNPLVASGTVELNGCSSPTTTVHVKAASLDQGCPQGQVAQDAQLNITQIGAARPDSISATLANPSDTVQVPLDKLAGQTAQYVVSLKNGQAISDATAVVPAAWSGEFVLSHYDCTTAPTSTPTQTQGSCDSNKNDGDGSTKAWYSNLAWTVNGKGKSNDNAQAALNAAKPGDKIVLTGDVDVPANCTTQAFAALYLVPKNGNQILLDSDTVVSKVGQHFTLTVTLPTPPNDLVACNTQYTLQYDSGVGIVLPIIGTDNGKMYEYGDRKFDNGFGKVSFTAPPCETESPTPTPTSTPTHTPTPTPTTTQTVTPSPSPSSTPPVTPSPSPTHSTPAPVPSTQSPPATGPTPNTINAGGGWAASTHDGLLGSTRGAFGIALFAAGALAVWVSLTFRRRRYGTRS